MAKSAALDPSSAKETVNALYENKAATTRTSPRKRKDPPTQTTETPSQLKRIKRSLLRSKPTGSSSQRTNSFDLPTEDATERIPKTKKVRTLKANVHKKDHFDGVVIETMHLPESESIDSPAKGTRSHGPISGNIQDIGLGPDHKQRDGGPSVSSSELASGNLKRASQRSKPRASPAQAVEPTTPTRGRARPSKSPTTTKTSRRLSDDGSRGYNPPHPAVVAEPSQESGNESDSDYYSADERVDSAQQEETESTREDFETGKEEYDCGAAWRAILKTAHEMAKDRRPARLKTTEKIIDTLKYIKTGYRTIQLSASSEASLKDAEAAVHDGIEVLETTCARLGERILERDVVQEVYEQAIPRSVGLAELALRTRFADHNLTTDAMEEVLDIVEAAIRFCNVTIDAKRRSTDLDTRKQVRNIVRPNLKFIRRQYITNIIRHKATIARDTERRKRAATAVREQQREAERKVREAEEYQEALRVNRLRDRERKARLEWDEAEKLARERKSWRDKLMADPSEQAAILRTKLGISLLSQRSPPAAEFHDVDDWDIDESNLPVNGTHSAAANTRLVERPKPRREPTADIPAEPQEWTKEEKIAFSNGLQEFQGPNRYHDILNAPRYGHWLRDRDEMELMQMGLFLKQSMASKLEKSGGELKGDWEYLMSIPG